MKLKNILKYFDSFEHIVIWGTDDSNPLFEGSVMDVPWWIAKLCLDTNHDESPIRTSITKHPITSNPMSTLVAIVVDNEGD